MEKGGGKMVFTLLGIQSVNFINNAGDRIEGVNLFCAYEDENVSGYRTEKFFIKPEIKLPELKLKDSIKLNFNMKGKVESVTKA